MAQYSRDDGAHHLHTTAGLTAHIRRNVVAIGGSVDIDTKGLTECHLDVSLWRTTSDAFVRTQRVTGEVESRGTLDDEELQNG